MSTINFSYSPGSPYLFQRAYALTFGPKPLLGPQLPSVDQGAFQYGTIIQNGGKPAPLRVVFDIERYMYGASPNHSKISIYGLSLESRKKINTGFLVQLEAGYKGLIGTIFVGNVFIAKTERKESDIVTELECLDGGQAITMGRLDKSYPAGVLLSQILTDVAKAMGVSAGIALDIPVFVYNKGFIATGACKDTLDKLLVPRALEWNIQNGNLNILPIKKAFTTTAEIVSSGVSIDPKTGIPVFNINDATGLIGVPSQNNGFVQFSHLLNPRLVPGTLIQIKSQAINGYYKIRKSHFEGDTHDNKWNVNCEALPLPSNNGNVEDIVVNGFDYGGDNPT